MLHEVNANAALPASWLRLRADESGRIVIDGGPGFALVLKVETGDPVVINMVGGEGRTTILKLGESAVIRSRTEVRAAGIDGYVSIGRHPSDASLRRERASMPSDIGLPNVVA